MLYLDNTLQCIHVHECTDLTNSSLFLWSSNCRVFLPFTWDASIPFLLLFVSGELVQMHAAACYRQQNSKYLSHAKNKNTKYENPLAPADLTVK